MTDATHDAWSDTTPYGFATAYAGEWDPTAVSIPSWLVTDGKAPHAPWADVTVPPEPGSTDGYERARWGNSDLRCDFEHAREHVRWSETDGWPVFILQAPERTYADHGDPLLVVDLDDVRDPETGEVIPAAAALLDRLGWTYVSASKSDGGLHAIYRGELPEGYPSGASWTLRDEPVFGHDDPPKVEIYDRKRAIVMTGRRIAGSTREAQPVDEETLVALLDEHAETKREPRAKYHHGAGVNVATGRSGGVRYTGDVWLDADAVEDALGHLDPDMSYSDWLAVGFAVHDFDDGATGRRLFEDWSRGGSKWDADAERTIDHLWRTAAPGGGITVGTLVHLAREAGWNPGEWHPSDSTGQATGMLPLALLDAIDAHERATDARRRGEGWPTTKEARERLFDSVAEVLRHSDDRVVEAPTSLGKTHTVAATRWGARDDLTGGRPVVHLLETRDARDEAVAIARREGGSHLVLRSRHEACPVAAGDHDDEITVDGTPASEWFATTCEGRGIPFSATHRHLERRRGGELPCQADGLCEAIDQWRRFREGDHALIIATHNFAHAPGLRMGNNVVIDERPDFTDERLTTDRVRRAVGAYLREIDAPVSTWEAFIQLARYEGRDGDAAVEREALDAALDAEPDRDWYFENRDAHTLAPALSRAIFNAEPRANGRRAGKTPFEPPRLDANARADDGWNREWVTVVLDDTNEVHTVRVVPDFGAARSVVGLDAHPALPVWQANTVPWIQRARVLDGEERRRWRQHERGLRVVPVDDATRPLASGKYFDERGAHAVVEQLAQRYGRNFRTAITAKAVESNLRGIMAEFVDDPETLHFGEEKSRNDFAGERIGFVNGCIDPGDDYVLDLLAELDLDAEPERADPADCDDPGNAACQRCEGDGCAECHGTGRRRAVGRGFVGEDADTAAAILASVRENHTAQATGRYARNPDDPDDTATVFVRTDALPLGFADVQVPGVVWTYSENQERIAKVLRESTTALTAREIADRVDVTKRSVQRFLNRLVEHGTVNAIKGAGPHGATLYADSGMPHAGVADLGDLDLDEIATDGVSDPCTWTVAIRGPRIEAEAREAVDVPVDGDDSGLWRWTEPPEGGDGGQSAPGGEVSDP